MELLEAAKVLGVAGPGQRLSSDIDYLILLDKGLPLKSLDIICDALAPADASFKYRIVPKATLARTKARRKLNTEQSVLITRLANVWSTAMRVWKSPGEARAFLYRPHMLLDNRRPIDLVLKNEIGSALVEDVLGRLEHGTAV